MSLPTFHASSMTLLRARLPKPSTVRGSLRPADCQNRRMRLSSSGGALQTRVTFAPALTRAPPPKHNITYPDSPSLLEAPLRLLGSVPTQIVNPLGSAFRERWRLGVPSNS